MSARRRCLVSECSLFLVGSKWEEARNARESYAGLDVDDCVTLRMCLLRSDRRESQSSQSPIEEG